MTFDSIPLAFVNEQNLIWSTKAFSSLPLDQQTRCIRQAAAVSNNLVTEVLLADGPFQSVASIPVADAHRILAFSTKESNAGMPSSSIELLALLVHDLRSPITSIYGFAETIVESNATFSAEEVLVFLRKIRGAALRANVLLTNMQALASGVRATAKARKFQINSLIREVLDGMWLEPGARLNLTLDSADTEVELDYIAAERIIGNLLNNAAKFCSNDGEIHVSSRAVLGGVQVSIYNSGAQIPPDELPMIFEKFHRGTTSKGKPGTGLGLFIVKHLASQIGAELNVESTESGTRFSIFFPTSKLKF